MKWMIWSDGLTEESANRLLKYHSNKHKDYIFKISKSEFHDKEFYQLEGLKIENQFKEQLPNKTN